MICVSVPNIAFSNLVIFDVLVISVMDELFNSAKTLSDDFLKIQFSGVYFEIRLLLSEEFMKPSHILCKIHIFEKTFCGNKLLRKIGHSIKRKPHLQTFAQCLDELKAIYCKKCPALSDSE